MGATLKCEKKKNPVNHRFTGLFLRRFRMMGLNQRQPIKKGEIYSRFFSSEMAEFGLLNQFVAVASS